MKYLFLLAVLMVVGAGCADDGQTQKMEDSILKNKIICQEKGEKYVGDDNYGLVNTEYSYNKKLDTCLVYFKYITGKLSSSMTLQKVEDILAQKVILFSRSGDGTGCAEWEENCFTPEEFDLKKKELFK